MSKRMAYRPSRYHHTLPRVKTGRAIRVMTTSPRRRSSTGGAVSSPSVVAASRLRAPPSTFKVIRRSFTHCRIDLSRAGPLADAILLPYRDIEQVQINPATVDEFGQQAIKHRITGPQSVAVKNSTRSVFPRAASVSAAGFEGRMATCSASIN